MPPTDTTPKAVRCFGNHGVVLDKLDTDEAVGECPMCGKRKFHVEVETTKWHCKVCGSKGNAVEFLRLVHAESMKATKDYSWLSGEKGLSGSALRAWGVCRSFLTGEWIVPGYNASGKLVTLFRYLSDSTGYHYLSNTSGMTVGVFLPVTGLPDDAAEIDVCEGLWDAIAWSEASKRVVVGVPGCSNFQESWVRLTHNRAVTFLFDNDHPRVNRATGTVSHPGFDGTKRTVDLVSRVPDEDKPKSVSYLDWSGCGRESNAELPDGFDVRDCISLKNGEAVPHLLSLVKLVPPEWTEGKSSVRTSNRTEHVRPVVCRSWKEVTDAWKIAAKWSKELEGALAVCLASIVSVKGQGEQLWVKLMSPASTYKSKLCGAFALSRRYVVEDDGMNGFFSGYNDAGKGEKPVDRSLASRLFDKTLVTKEGATLVDSPMKDVIVSQARALYDRDASKNYNNGVRWEYDELSFSWILAGTPEALRRLDKTELGPRFIDYQIMKEIDHAYETEIMRRSLYKQATAGVSNCKAGSTMDDDYRRACQLTAGYLEHLRQDHDGGDLVPPVPDSDVLNRIGKLATFIEYMRARPSALQEESVTRALATRVGGQLVKASRYLAVVTGRRDVESSVMRVVEKVARDTSEGRTLEIVKAVYESGTMGLDLKGVARETRVDAWKEAKYLEFLTRIRALEQFDAGIPSLTRCARWRLTKEFRRLYREVVGEK